MDALLTGRVQFAANVTFHILFPSITISLAWFLLFFRIRLIRTGDVSWEDAYRFWVKVFALTFGLGVVSGITMSFQFGTNWPGFMEKVGNVAGPLLTYEVMTAFFMEATFLGIMLFGSGRVSQRVHLISNLLVASGTTLSAFWIVSLNAWMHTPDGFVMNSHNVAIPTDWFKVIFNPSLLPRFTHVVLSSFLTTSFIVAGISSYRYLRGDTCRSVFLALRFAIIVAAICSPLQMIVGDIHGLNSLKYNPQSIAAIEGLFKTQKGAPAIIFGIPQDEGEGRVDYELSIPRLASLYLTHDLSGEVKGISDFKDHPPVLPVFMAFRVMVFMSILMVIFSWLAFFKTNKGWDNFSPRLAKILVLFSFSGWIAVVAGWYTTEVSRQPFLVMGVLKTAAAATKLLPREELWFSLFLYLTTYLVLLVIYVYTIFYLARLDGRKNKAVVAGRGVMHESD
ncbi:MULTISPECIES: cytochrome ubiquinol oxidase subunit I [Candidatus Ichthyocystis]|uniref:cytochrome ubiquinol oxidase subunit I n=1 Tax=Candidatus Ichthyocystis TaxID=2929841 RepID=UPI000A7EE259|nr:MULTISPECIES: cytochrome ubiquinol oxidase subunit I [Ichthyocystis]